MAALSRFRGFLLSSIFLYINLYLQNHQMSAQTYLGYSCTGATGNYSQKSKYKENLDSIISSVTFNINTYGFYNGTAGYGVDQVNAIVLCRGDVDIKLCRSCVNLAANLTVVRCPNEKEAITWYEECMFRYSNNKILGIMSIDPGYLLQNAKYASNVTLFRQELSSLARILVDQTYNLSFRRFAVNKFSDPNAQPVYGFMQCTPDITPSDCKSCLDRITNDLSDCCFDQVGARWITPNCVFRFETYSFIKVPSNQPPLPTSSQSLPLQLSPPPLQLSSSKGKSSRSKKIIIVVCAIVVLISSTVCAYIFIARRRRQNTSKGHELKEKLEDIGDTVTKQYEFSVIKVATRDFSNSNLLGRGGFGDVYKGVLSDGKEIAVKRLSATSGQGDKEFENEVLLLARLQHICLVKLLGFCLEQKESLLVYEFMENGSLDKILFDEVNRSRLDWNERYRIINNVAKGLLYLHEDSRLMIIHRDLKASNILLDKEMNAKISDFGMARLFVRDDSEVITKRIAGTLGYMAPEYAMHGLFSVKSDVYSYGVLLLEIICGKRNYFSITEDKAEGLLSYVYRTWKSDRAFDLIDPVVTDHSNSLEIIMRCIHVALLCVQESIGSRPTMATVVLMLQSLTIPLPLPSEPGFFGNTRSWLSQFLESTSSTSQSNPQKLGLDAAHNDPWLNEETNSYLYPR